MPKITHSTKRRLFANLHGFLFSLKNGRFRQIHRTGFVEKLRAMRAVGPQNFSDLASEPNPWQAGLRYETTKEYDDNLDYDKRFKPAYLYLVSHEGAEHTRKATLDEEP